MTQHTIETVTFNLASNTSKEDFLKTLPLSSQFMTAQPGFVSRRLSCNDAGQWIEQIEWVTLKDAQSASDAIMKDETIMPFMHCIDGPNATVQHTQLEVSIG